MPLFAVIAITFTLLISPAHAQAGVPVGVPVGRPGLTPVVFEPLRADQRLDRAWEQLEAVVEQYNEVHEDLAATLAKLAALRERARPLEAATLVREAEVGDLASMAYRAGGPAEINTLLAAASPEQFSDRLMMMEHLASQQSRALESLRQAKKGYDSARAALDKLAADRREQQKRLAERKRYIKAEIRRLEGLRRDLPGTGWTPVSHPDDGYVPAYAPGKAGAAVRFAFRQLGKPYQWGAEGPYGYDCSGLTLAAWRAAGVHLPHNAARQWQSVTAVSRAELRQGDLVFYYGDIHHVALYAGDGRVVHAPTQGEPVRVQPMGFAPIYGFGRPRTHRGG